MFLNASALQIASWGPIWFVLRIKNSAMGGAEGVIQSSQTSAWQSMDRHLVRFELVHPADDFARSASAWNRSGSRTGSVNALSSLLSTRQAKLPGDFH